MPNYKQGIYEVQNKAKYVGKKNPRYLSSYELHVFHKFDLNPHILEWGAECVIVPYYNPVKQRQARYIVDVYVKYQNAKGEIKQELIEIKPSSQVKKPRNSKKKKPSTLLTEQLTFAINKAKWESATIYAKKRGMTFRVITETNIWA